MWNSESGGAARSLRVADDNIHSGLLRLRLGRGDRAYYGQHTCFRVNLQPLACATTDNRICQLSPVLRRARGNCPNRASLWHTF